MKNRTRIALLCLLACAPMGRAAAAAISVVEIHQGEVAIGPVGGSLRQITDDRVGKGLPAFSPDGTRIAFVERTSPDVALARLVVVTSAGQPVSSALVAPYSPDVMDAGMRFVEAVRWITNDRVAVSGSLNPSTSEYLVFDLPKGQFIADVFDDGFGAGFSPNGRDMAYVRGSPHFLPPDKQRPALYVNDRKVFPTDGAYRAILSRPQFSATGHAVAAILAGADGAPDTLLVWHMSGLASRIPLPGLHATRAHVSWGAMNDIFVFTDGPYRSAWRVAALGGEAVKVDADMVASVMADTLRTQLDAAVRSATGGVEPDFWCGQCLLATPR